jgi:predicted transcriptional regulator of viral defense system
VQKEGFPRKYVYRLHDQGKIEKINRGLYKIPEKEFTENQMLLVVAKKYQGATICLLSALRFHEMTSQNHIEFGLPSTIKTKNRRLMSR